jgi:carotenoid cleavage dioxygenase-like enzyme
MVHAMEFKDGRALSYNNHYLRCERFVHEQEEGKNIYLRVRILSLAGTGQPLCQSSG